MVFRAILLSSLALIAASCAASPNKKIIEPVKVDEGNPSPATQPRRSFKSNTPSKSRKNPLALEREREEREKKEKLKPSLVRVSLKLYILEVPLTYRKDGFL